MAYTVGVYVLLIIGDNACGLITRLLSPAERAAEEQPGPLARVRRARPLARPLARVRALEIAPSVSACCSHHRTHPTKRLTSAGPDLRVWGRFWAGV